MTSNTGLSGQLSPLQYKISKLALNNADNRVRMRTHFEGQDPAEHGQRWDQLWKDNFTPWDNESPNPALIDVLNEREDLAPKKPDGSRKKALVAGCGKGYDVLLLSAMGYDAYGLDISETGLQGAKDTEKKKDGKGVYTTKEGVEKGKVNWLFGDFFGDDFFTDVEGEKTFDLIYDYTVCNLSNLLITRLLSLE
jgi:SAM-dependent methyltransferase